MNSKSKHLLMISYPFPPVSSAGAMRSERFARHLSESGWKISVVTIRTRTDLFHDTGRLELFNKNVQIHQTRTIDPWLWMKNRKTENIILKAFRSIIMKLFSFPDHMALWVPFAVREGMKIHKIDPVDAIYTTSPPHSTHLAGVFLTKRLGVPWVADFRDPWTLNAYRKKGLSFMDIGRLENMMENSVYKNASVILANTKSNRKNIMNSFPSLKPDRVIYLPNGWEEFPDQTSIAPDDDNRFTIVHAGTFYPRFKPYALFNALSEWKRGKQPPYVPPLDKNIRVVILGSRDEETRRIVTELEIQELVDFIPWVALEEARRYMCKADLLWATLGTGKESSTYVPSKLLEYISAKRPIIGFFPEGDAESLIRETGTGTVFVSDETTPVIKFLSDMISGKKAGASYNPNMDAVNNYSIKSIASRLNDVLNSLVIKKMIV
jgi:glycosyltransferase involved in cell wall biosynthesis